MLPISLVVAFVISMICTLLLPIVLVLTLIATRKISILPVLAGCLSFFISQIILRIPLLQWLGTQGWFAAFAANTLVYVVVIGGFSAGLFEETARLIGVSLLKKHRSYWDMIGFGLGHGLCEVVLLVGVGQINNLLLCAMIADTQIASVFGVQQELLQIASQQLANTIPAMVYLGVVERISAVAYHLFATALIFLAVTQKRPLYYLAALVAHTVFNSMAVLLLSVAGMWVCEGVLLLAAVPMVWFVYRQKEVLDSTKGFAQTST